MQFEDKDNYLLWSLFPYAVILYCLCPVLDSFLSFLEYGLALIISLVLYFFLWVHWPDIFGMWTIVPHLLFVAIGTVCLVLMAHSVSGHVLLIFLALVAIPVVQHNAAWIAVMFGTAPWTGYLYMVLLLVLLGVLLWSTALVPKTQFAVKAVLVSVFLADALRLMWMEWDPDTHKLTRRDLACGGSEVSSDPPGRCPYAWDSWTWLGVTALLLSLQLLFGYWLWKRDRQKRRDLAAAQRQRRIARYEQLLEEGPASATDPSPQGPTVLERYAHIIEEEPQPCPPPTVSTRTATR